MGDKTTIYCSSLVPPKSTRSFLIAASRRPFFFHILDDFCHSTGQFLMTSISRPELGLHSGITDVISLVDVVC